MATNKVLLPEIHSSFADRNGDECPHAGGSISVIKQNSFVVQSLEFDFQSGSRIQAKRLKFQVRILAERRDDDLHFWEKDE